MKENQHLSPDQIKAARKEVERRFLPMDAIASLFPDEVRAADKDFTDALDDALDNGKDLEGVASAGDLKAWYETGQKGRGTEAAKKLLQWAAERHGLKAEELRKFHKALNQAFFDE